MAGWRKVAIYILSSLALLAVIGVFAFVSSRMVPAAAQTPPPTPTPRPAPSITVSPATALPNQTIVIRGSNFTTGGGVTITSITIDGAPIPAAKINDGDRVGVYNAGDFIAVVIIPVNDTSLQAGPRRVVVTPSKGSGAESTLTIPERTITVEPSISRVGTNVTVVGTNFPFASPKPAADPTSLINIEYEMVGIPTRVVATAVPDASGKFTTSFTVPLNARIPSENTVVARVAGTAATATLTHSVPAASVTVSPTSGPPGARLTVTGSNFRGFDPVRSVTIGRVRVPPLSPSSTNTNAEGSFSATVVVPEIDVGFQPMAVEAGELRAIAIFEVLPVPPPPPPLDSVDPAIALAPLGAILVRVWVFDAATELWLLYDPASPALSDLKRLNRGDGFWINVTEDTKVTLGAGTYTLKKGWNLKGWLG